MVRGVAAKKPSRHVSLRERLKGMEFDVALPLAVKALFRFSHRAKDAKALWASHQNVWIGRPTVVHWSLNDEFDVPWLVAKSKNAPRSREDLNERVKTELASHFAECLSSLPKKSSGSWLPLP